MPLTRAFRSERRLLTIGFGALLVLICIASVEALAVLRQVRSSETRIRDAYLRRESLMEDIRTSIYQSSTVERDYLLAATSADAQHELDRWREIRVKSDNVIEAYSLNTDAADVRRFQHAEGRSRSRIGNCESTFRARGARQKPGSYNPEETRDRRRSMLAVVDRLDDLHTQQFAWRTTRS